jgi:hypothetical protein
VSWLHEELKCHKCGSKIPNSQRTKAPVQTCQRCRDKEQRRLRRGKKGR